jgi:hypothetical protein
MIAPQRRLVLARGPWGSVALTQYFTTERDSENGNFEIKASIGFEAILKDDPKSPRIVSLWKARWVKGVLYDKERAAERFDRLSVVVKAIADAKFRSFSEKYQPAAKSCKRSKKR